MVLDEGALGIVVILRHDLVAAILRQASRVVFNIGEVEANHMITSLVGILGVVGVWATTYRLAGEKDAWWAALFLSITPVYYGHMYINPKDIPFAVGCIWSLYSLLGIVLDLPRMNWRKMAFFCLMAGLTMAIRVMGVYLLLLFSLALAWNMVDNLLRLKAAASEQILKGLILPVGLVCLGSICDHAHFLALGAGAQLRAVQPLAERGRAFDGKYQIPTFEEGILLVKRKSVEKRRGIGIYAETKHPTYHQSIGLPLEERLLDALRRAGWNRRGAPVFIQSFETANLRYLRTRTDLPLTSWLMPTTSSPTGP